MDYVTNTADLATCPHCGMGHTGACPRVKAIEYYENGTIKRVEYHEPQASILGGHVAGPVAPYAEPPFTPDFVIGDNPNALKTT